MMTIRTIDAGAARAMLGGCSTARPDRSAARPRRARREAPRRRHHRPGARRLELPPPVPALQHGLPHRRARLRQQPIPLEGRRHGKEVGGPEPRVLPVRAQPLPVRIMALGARSSGSLTTLSTSTSGSTRTCASTTRTIPRPPSCDRRSAGGTWSSTETSRRTRRAPTSFATSCSTTIPRLSTCWRGAARALSRGRSSRSRIVTRERPIGRRSVRRSRAKRSSPSRATRTTRTPPTSARTGRTSGLCRADRAASALGYGAFVFASAENAPYFSADWTRENVSSEGPFGAHYRVWGDGKQMVQGRPVRLLRPLGPHRRPNCATMGYVVWLPPRPKGEFLGEGDTFTYLNLIDNGLARVSRRHARAVGVDASR